MKKRVGIIGFGNMGSAIAERVKDKYAVFVYDKDKNKLCGLKDIKVAENNIDLVGKADVVILAVKPQDFDIVLEEIKNYIKGKLIVSIAAGVATNYIEKRLGNTRVVRVMPNLPARIGKGIICLCKGNFAEEDDLSFVKVLFDYLGETLMVREDQMDAVTAISGSGPGIFYRLIQLERIDPRNIEEIERFARESFIPALTVSAVKIGVTKDQAKILVTSTATGSIELLKSSGLQPWELEKQVTSKKGTTEAGLKKLRKKKLRNIDSLIDSLTDAVKAAAKRAKELSKGE